MNIPQSCPGRDWHQAPLSDLIVHIVDIHHVNTRNLLRSLGEVLDTAANQYSAGRPQLDDLRRVFRLFESELAFHLLKEEMLLFPRVQRMEGQAVHVTPGRETNAELIDLLEREHRHGNELLAQMRSMAQQTILPPPAAPLRNRMLAEFEKLAEDMQAHVFEEDKVLFPRTLASAANSPPAP